MVASVRARMPRLSILLVLALMLAGVTVVSATPALAATGPCGTGGNPIACENAKPGSPKADWDVVGAGDDDIQGFSTDISVNVGSPISFKIDTDASAYTITIFRMGYYGGDGARQITTVPVSAHLPQIQPNCITDATVELTDCGNWGVSATWNVPSDAVSGVYIAHLYRPDNQDSSNITFIVRNDASHSDIVFQTSDPTWEAYNTYGGSDFYTGGQNGRAYEVSYNRPVTTRQDESGGQDFFMANEYPMVRFLERNGYDVSYISGVDTDRSGGLLLNHKIFMSVGHDEYWSGAQRANVEAARDAGVNLQFLSGNEVYWRTRYLPSLDSSHTNYRTLVSYKEGWSGAKIDPSAQSTSTWRDPRYAPTSQGGGLPENSLTGTIFMNNFIDQPLTVTKAEGKLRLWRNTGLSSMFGSSTALAPHTVGYESDEDEDNGFRPAGLIDLSTTTAFDSGQFMYDYSTTTGDNNTTHSLTLYRAPSGALVFGAGTVQWSWGLDDDHDSPYDYEPADPRMQQAQINLNADMGAQPATLMSGMVAATKSTDTTGPTVSISSPASGAAEPNGAQVTVTGTAFDNGGGVVAGVEYSTDGGSSWHPATGTSSWSFTYTQHGVGSTNLRVRGIDDSANIGATVTRAFNVSCPCTVYGQAGVPTQITSTSLPATTSANDSGSAELGLRFTPQVDGFVSGVRFYKGTGNTGTHVGSLWDTSGQRLAQVTFSNETSTGWQTATFASPVPVTAGTTYVASYTDPNGHYANQPWSFQSAGIAADPLSVAGGFSAAPAGVFGDPGSYPGSSFHNSSYFVDPVFTTSSALPLTASSQWPAAGATSVPLNTTISAVFSKAVNTATLGVSVKDQNGASVAGTTSYNATSRTVTFTPSAALNGLVTYTVTLTATSTDGTALTTGKSWSFTTLAPQGSTGPFTIFNSTQLPDIASYPDGSDVTLGVRFTADANGTVPAVRFYKGSSNTGTHTGALWTADGTKLASGTFTNESASGWQTLTFAQPVTVTKGTTYVASYHAPLGGYAVTPNGLASPIDAPPLHATSGAYASGDAFPGNATATDYYVDVVYSKATPTLTVASETPADGATAVSRGTTISITFSTAISAGATMTVTQQPAGTSIAGTTATSSDGTTLTFTPSASLPADADIRTQVTGISASGGLTLPTQTWTFHTKAATASSETLMTTQVPATPAVNDSGAVEVGTAFSSAASGTVTGIRFYKGTGNTGTHVGHLWSSSGQLLATVTFTGESASGWQEAALTTPVHLTAGESYVVSYFAPNGHYSGSPGFFSTTLSNGDLTAPSGNNGLYVYAASGGLPVYSYNSTNYFVDVDFTPDPPSSTPPSAPGSPLLGTITPQTTSVNDGNPVELGMAFSPSVNGSATAIRFYKGAGNGGTHTGTIWSSTGQALATVTFTGETASGWQQAILSTPLALTAGQTYVVSYYAPLGHYSATPSYFASPVTAGPLTARGGNNGLFHYATGGGYPTDSYNSSNYFVDVVFQPSS